MSKRKKHVEEHENLERWLVSYADFITLLFATFVVLYALSQIDVASFTKLEDSIRKAFAAPSILSGSPGLMNTSGDSIFDTDKSSKNETIVPPILEHLSATYEENSYKEIKESIDKMKKKGELEGVEANITERGLIIDLMNMNLFFQSGTATLKKESYSSLEKVGNLLGSKFQSHLIRIEGHTDNEKMSSGAYPSNWELSSARASSVVRFLIEKFKFNKERFSVVGYADTKPIESNKTEEGRQKNRRVGIVVLRNKLAKSEAETDKELSAEENSETSPIQKSQLKELHKYKDISDAARRLVKDSGSSIKDVLLLKDRYEDESKKIQEELEQKEKEKKIELKLPVYELRKPAEVSVKEREKIYNANKKGVISDAVAELMQDRGVKGKTIVIKNDKKPAKEDSEKKLNNNQKSWLKGIFEKN